MENNQENESFYYVKSAIQLMKRHWVLFSFSVSGCVSLALFINWYVQPVFEISSVIIIEDNNQNNKPASTEEFMKTFSIFSPVSNIQQEIIKMKSTELVYKALKKINAEIGYYQEDGIKTIELHNNSPFEVLFDRNHLQPMQVKFYIESKSENQFQLFAEENDEPIALFNYKENKGRIIQPFFIHKTINYGDTVESDLMRFKVLFNKEKMESLNPGSKFFFVLNDLKNLTYDYQKSIEIEQVAKEIPAAKLSLKSKDPETGIDFINALTEAYLQRNIEKKNNVAENTIKYLDEQLGIIEDSLSVTEQSLQSFRSDNKIMDIRSKSEITFNDANKLEKEKEELKQRLGYYKELNTNLRKDTNGSSLIIPSSLGGTDNVLSGLIEEYIRLNSEKNDLILNNQTRNPYYKMIGTQIENQKNTLSENIKNMTSSTQLQLDYLQQRLSSENYKINKLPTTDRNLVGIERKYKLNDDNYNFMIRKKAEAQVAKASNMQSSDIVEPARLTQFTPVFPNKKVNLGVGFFLGLVLPFVGFGVKSLFNNTVPGVNEMQSITSFPSIGRVYHRKSRKKHTAVLIDEPRSAISESLRLVRTNIEYALQGRRNQVILLTSTMQGEGKSFNSLNLAISLALLNRKTILVDFDIRNPNLYQSLKVENKLGVSSFLEASAGLEEIIIQTSISNLDFISAGPTPANPVELTSSERAELLINKLKDEYDYIIIDTPPIGLVTEALILMKYADMNIFVVREKKTPKKQLTTLLQEMEHKNMNHIYWLLNDVEIRGTFHNKKKLILHQRIN